VHDRSLARIGQSTAPSSAVYGANHAAIEEADMAKRRRRAAQGALAIGTSAAVLCVGAPGAAAQTAVTTTITCTIETVNGRPQPRQVLRTSGLAPNRDYVIFIFADSDVEDLSLDGIGWETDGSGVLTPPNFSDNPPSYFAWTVYDDTSGNGKYTPDVDRTYFRGEGTITACPQTITLSPK
jgi:hypothetical protein